MSFYKIFPQPFREILTISTQEDALDDDKKKDLRITIFRVALAAIGMLATYQLGLSLGVAVTAGAVLNPPALAIAAGSWLIYSAVVATATAVSSASFTGLAVGLAGGAAGVYILEHTAPTRKYGHAVENFDDFITGPVGLIENAIHHFTK